MPWIVQQKQSGQHRMKPASNVINDLFMQVDNVAHWGDILQMAVLELIRKVCRAAPGEKGKYIKIILALLQSTSTAVVYECAVTLVSLSNAPTAITAAANCYCQMLVSQSDNNVKLIVLDRLQVIGLCKTLHGRRKQEFTW
jgi:coatomer subunit beta